MKPRAWQWHAEEPAPSGLLDYLAVGALVVWFTYFALGILVGSP